MWVQRWKKRRKKNTILFWVTLVFLNPSPLLPNFGDLPVPCLVTWWSFCSYSPQKGQVLVSFQVTKWASGAIDCNGSGQWWKIRSNVGPSNHHWLLYLAKARVSRLGYPELMDSGESQDTSIDFRSSFSELSATPDTVTKWTVPVVKWIPRPATKSHHWPQMFIPE